MNGPPDAERGVCKSQTLLEPVTKIANPDTEAVEELRTRSLQPVLS
jgi:hypothetical protein